MSKKRKSPPADNKTGFKNNSTTNDVDFESKEEVDLNPPKKTKKILATKSLIKKTLSGASQAEPSKYSLIDITFETDTNSTVNSVGRPKVVVNLDVKSIILPNQMRHVIPYTFIEKIIEHTIVNTNEPINALRKLAQLICIFAKDKLGFAISEAELETDNYQKIASSVTEFANRRMSLKDSKNEDSSEGINILFTSPNRLSKVKTFTPTKQVKAKKLFAEHNPLFIKEALEKLVSILESNDINAITIAAELMSRLLTTLFNSEDYVAFANDGNTSLDEIRLYKNKKSAKTGSSSTDHKADYTVITAREVEEMIKKNEKLDGLIRIVNSEGANTKSALGALEFLNKIILDFQAEGKFDNDLLNTYNNKYNFELKLANNTHDLSKYNTKLQQSNAKTNIPSQAAKILYGVFDLTALEDKVFVVGGKKNKSGVEVYLGAKGDRTAKFTIKDGTEHREAKIDANTTYNTEKVFRSSETDLKILHAKLAELVFLGISPFSALQKGFNKIQNELVAKILEEITTIAALDYCMNSSETKKLQNNTQEVYKQLVEFEQNPDLSKLSSLEILGENCEEINNILSFD